ncbi:MAG: hypothetical protein Q4C49_00590 [Bacillota bacterium]|nr:hypothetical protein [Bacillota bacterium]
MDHAYRQNAEDMDGEILLKSMLSPAVLTQSFISNWAKSGFSLGERRLFLTLGGKQSTLQISGDENQVVLSFVDGNGRNVQDPIYLVPGQSTLFDLWKGLGAQYVKEETENGNLDYSDASQELCAFLMSKFDPSLKNKMIAKLIDEEASKSSQGPKNSKEDLLSGNPLAYTYLDTSCYGIQQDYSHHADDSNIPALSQVITAIAFNGENVQLV